MPVGQQVTRRTLLRAAAASSVAGATGVAAGCSSEAGSPRPAPKSTPAASSGGPAEPPDWAALRKKLRGDLVLPADNGYAAAAKVYNPLFDGRRPAAIARCERPEDVQACVEAAAAARFPIAARSGGHSYAGYSNPDEALIVDLGSMSAVNPRGPHAEIGAGARLIDVYAGLSVEGRCVPAGSCPSVGIAGLTLGGGIGVLSRRFGLTCDHLESAEVVKADGSLVTASADSEPDLFWALRGGGGGNFGIVTSFTFTTAVAPSELTVFSLQFPAGSAVDVVEEWQRWIVTQNDEMWSNCVVSAGSPPTVRVGGCYVGAPDVCRRRLNTLLGRAPAPTSELVTAKSYLDTMRHFAGCSDRSVEQCRPAAQGGELDRSSFVASSRILAKPLSDPTALVSLLDGRSELDLLLDSLGGRVSFTRPEQTAFPHRDALASVQIYANTTAGRQSATRQVHEVLEDLGRLTGQLGYVNYIDPNMPNWDTAYYGGNIARLQDIAARYDPDGVFAFDQGIKPR